MPVEQAIEAGMGLLYSNEFIQAKKEELLKRALEMSHLMAPPHGLQAQFMAAILHNTYDKLGSIRAPTLVLSGTADRIVPHPNSVLISQSIPGARLVEYEGAGHGFLVERADEVNEVVIGFLGQTASGRK